MCAFRPSGLCVGSWARIFRLLGLTEAEQLEGCRSVVDLVRSRLEKAGRALARVATQRGHDPSYRY